MKVRNIFVLLLVLSVCLCSNVNVNYASAKAKTEYYLILNMGKKSVPPNVKYKSGRIYISDFYAQKASDCNKIEEVETKKYSARSWKVSGSTRIKIWDEIDERFLSYSLKKYVKKFGKTLKAPALVIKIKNTKVSWIEATV